jgi:hypothetical protein
MDLRIGRLSLRDTHLGKAVYFLINNVMQGGFRSLTISEYETMM